MSDKINKAVSAVSWLGAASGAGLPALTFFTSFAPPLFPGFSLLAAVLAGAILVIVKAWKMKAGGSQDGAIKAAIIFLGCALPLLVAYILFLQFTTVVDPLNDSTRYQIGFRCADFSLTKIGTDWQKIYPAITPSQLMMYEAAFDQDKVMTIWKTWSVYLAGSLLIIAHVLGFFCWAAGFAFLTKYQSTQPPSGNGGP